MVGECNCTWGAEEIKEELQELDMDGNIVGEDIKEWSEYDDMQDVHSIHDDTTEGEMDTSSEEMPPLVDAPEDSYEDDAEVPALPSNAVMTMPNYPNSNTIATTYIDDNIQYNNSTTTNNIGKYDICVSCNLPCTEPYQLHNMYECGAHKYCHFHNRWEGPNMGMFDVICCLNAISKAGRHVNR